ncbi:MAG TPA: histidine kinase [Polyangiaceae bacterium]|nr:histidine kinase [Polyangiaceae bacterium]
MSTRPGADGLRRLGKEYAKVQLVYNPLFVGVAVLGLGGGNYAFAFAISLTVAAVASSVSFVPVALALALAAFRLQRGHVPKPHGRAWYFALALLALPLGLFLAGEVTERVFGVRAPGSASDYRFGGFLGTLITVSFFAWQTRADARAEARAAELRAERAERLELEAQLAALRAQLDPHLLFNAFNTIAALIPTDAAAAERTLLRLAELYRGLLAAARQEQHSLERELDICRAYLDVERARFAERLDSAIELAAGLDPSRREVPVLILQPLVENAVRHGLSGRARGGALRVRAREADGSLELEVEDDGVGLGNSTQRGAGLALDTTRQRLQLRYGAAATLELSALPSGGTRARVRLPRAVLTSPNSGS